MCSYLPKGHCDPEAGKLAAVTEKLIVVGYSTRSKAYCLWNLTMDMIEERYDVTIDENNGYNPPKWDNEDHNAHFEFGSSTDKLSSVEEILFISVPQGRRALIQNAMGWEHAAMGKCR